MKKKGFQRGNEQSAAGHDARWGKREVRDAGEPAPAPRKPFPPQSVALITPPSTEVHTKRPLQLVPLLRTTRWRLMEVTPQYVYPPHQPHQPGSHRRSSLPPDSVHRCAGHAPTHAQLAADCAVGQATGTASAAQIEHSTSAAQQPTAQVWPLSASRCARPTQCTRARSTGLSTRLRLQPGDVAMDSDPSVASTVAP